LSLISGKDLFLRNGKIQFSKSIESIVIDKAFAPVEKMLYLSLWFQNVGFKDVLKHTYGKEWVKY
jgi:hypothetical protein